MKIDRNNLHMNGISSDLKILFTVTMIVPVARFAHVSSDIRVQISDVTIRQDRLEFFVAIVQLLVRSLVRNLILLVSSPRNSLRRPNFRPR